MLDIQIITNPNEIPCELKPEIDCATPSTTYLLYKNNKLTGWGQILFHNETEHEVAYINIAPGYRRQGLGSKLVHYMIYNCPSQILMLTTISPEFFLKLGFKKMSSLPSFVNYNDPECMRCKPKQCQSLQFSKPSALVKFRADRDCQSKYIQLLKEEESMISELSPVNNCMWALPENPYFIKIDDLLFIAAFPFENESYGVILPYPEIAARTLEKFFNILRSMNIKKIKYQTNTSLTRLKLAKRFTVTEDRDNFDYLYKTLDFANFEGSKFVKKRNRLKRFLKNHPQHSIIPYCKEQKAETLTFARDLTSKIMKLPQIYSYEILKHGLDNNLLKGFLLKVGETLVGLLFYSELNSSTAIVHFELIHPDFDGAAQLINNHLGLELKDNYTFINREQDMGLPGLRRSKLSYRPYRLLKKYDVKY
ncbi:GNAT family N-acetyltransferase [Candidatus Margulisiibacteriota bacterium]